MTTKNWLEKEGMIYDKSGYTIAITSLSVAADPEANAAFIVRACNCHKELVGALTGILRGWERVKESSPVTASRLRESCGDEWEDFGQGLADARVALAKAGGK
jgi:hypothetical protein